MAGAAPRSAGIVAWRRREGALEVLLAHFGGPYWARKEVGAWSIPKGLIEEGETPEQAARREYREELGADTTGDLVPLPPLRQKGGKWVHAFAMEGDFEPAALASNSFTLKWPRGSGRLQSFPEVDRVRWFSLAEAETMILPSQLPLLAGLRTLLVR